MSLMRYLKHALFTAVLIFFLASRAAISFPSALGGD